MRFRVGLVLRNDPARPPYPSSSQRSSIPAKLSHVMAYFLPEMARTNVVKLSSGISLLIE